jgi:hypothetical protein
MNHQIPLPKRYCQVNLCFSEVTNCLNAHFDTIFLHRNNIPVHKQAAICMDIVDLVTVLLTKFEINNS